MPRSPQFGELVTPRVDLGVTTASEHGSDAPVTIELMALTRMTFVRSMLVVTLGVALSTALACSSSSGGGKGDGTGGGTGGGGGADAAAEAATEAGAVTGTKANGASCAADGDCVSGHCKSQGTGGGGAGGTAGTFCTVFCSTPGVTPAAECSDPVFTTKCSGMSFCQVK